MQAVTLHPRPLATLTELLPPDQAERIHAAARRAAQALAGRVVWNINSTASGGGVAKMLSTTLGYLLAAGAQARWLVAGRRAVRGRRVVPHPGQPPGQGDRRRPAAMAGGE